MDAPSISVRFRTWFASASTKLGDKLRLWPLLVVFAIAFFIVLALNPAKLGLTIWGIAKLCLGLYIGYWGDRLAFPNARPHTLTGIEAGTAWKRRALILAACVIAAALIP